MKQYGEKNNGKNSNKLNIGNFMANIIEDINNNIHSKKNENNTLLIRKQFQKKGRFSVTIDRNSLYSNGININKKKQFQEQYFNNRNTICEVIAETNGDLIHKQNSDDSKDN